MLQNKGTKSNKRVKDYPFLANEAVWDDIFAVAFSFLFGHDLQGSHRSFVFLHSQMCLIYIFFILRS